MCHWLALMWMRSSSQVWMRSSQVWMRSSQVWMRSSQVWMRSSKVCMRSSQVWISSSQVWIRFSQVWMKSSQVWMRSSQVWIRSSQVWIRSSQVWWNLAKCGWDLANLWMRSSQVVRASDCQCQSRNSPGFDPSILRHSGIWGAAMKQCGITYIKIKNKILKIPLSKLARLFSLWEFFLRGFFFTLKQQSKALEKVMSALFTSVSLSL